MKGYIDNIETATVGNGSFRKVVYTAQHSQLVLMSLQPGEEIGEEVHEDGDQFFRVDRGEGTVTIDGVTTPIRDGFAVVVPAGSQHNVVNTSATEPLKLYTIYSPPHHRDGVEHVTREAALADDEHFDNKTTE